MSPVSELIRQGPLISEEIMATYLKSFLNDPTPQSEALDERQMANSAGGYSYPVNDMERLRRFLILGSEGGSYYASDRDLTKDNVGRIKRLISEDGRNAVDQIVQISSGRRAPKNGPALFALAIAASYGNDETRHSALTSLPVVARTGSHLLEFMSYVHSTRGWGRGLRKAPGLWYTKKACSDAVYQVVKYRNRSGWTHRDVLRIAHTKAESASHRALFKYVASRVLDPDIDMQDAMAFAYAFEQAGCSRAPDVHHRLGPQPRYSHTDGKHSSHEGPVGGGEAGRDWCQRQATSEPRSSFRSTHSMKDVSNAIVRPLCPNHD